MYLLGLNLTVNNFQMGKKSVAPVGLCFAGELIIKPTSWCRKKETIQTRYNSRKPCGQP